MIAAWAAMESMELNGPESTSTPGITEASVMASGSSVAPSGWTTTRTGRP